MAKSGGNYTTITAALAAINPTATAPYVIEVWPGVYTETATVNLKSYVHLKGSGRDVTTVRVVNGLPVLSVIGKTNVTISGFTITGSDVGDVGIDLASTTTNLNSVTISDNTLTNLTSFGIRAFRPAGGATLNALITGNNFTAIPWSGIAIQNCSATITRNSFSGIGQGTIGRSDGGMIVNGDGTQTHIITENVITGNNGVGIYLNSLATPVVSDNIITNNAMGGVKYMDSTTGGNLTNNKIINNGGALYSDIDATLAGQPNISFNVFNTIVGSSGVGAYNVKSNGDTILVP